MKNEWPTRIEDIEIATRILSNYGQSGEPLNLMEAEQLPDGQIRFSPAAWLGDMTKAFVKKHGENMGMEVLRLVLREIGVFDQNGNLKGGM